MEIHVEVALRMLAGDIYLYSFAWRFTFFDVHHLVGGRRRRQHH